MKKILFPISVIILIILNACVKEPIVLTDYGTLPVVELSIKEKYLWSIDSGLLLKQNYPYSWEFPANIKYSEAGEEKFNEDVGFRLKGKASRSKPMKSFGIYWKRKYGNKKLVYPMFPDITTPKFKRLFLRNSGNDFGKTHLRDASISSIFKDYANVEYQEYKPCVLYLNDEYWGIYNLREMITPHHFDYHFGVNDDEVDLLQGSELSPIADDGAVDDFVTDVINFIKANDLSLQDNYNSIADVIDIDSYIDNIIVNTYIYNTDWPVGNTKWWRDKTSENYTKWRWVIYDMDWSFEVKNVDKVWIGDLYGEAFSEEKKDGFFIFNNLIKNEEFKTVFLDRYIFFIETVFEKKRVENIINANKIKIEEEYTNHQKKWGLISKSNWIKSIDQLIEFNNKRNDKMKAVINSLR